jgi:hypothetical protein
MFEDRFKDIVNGIANHGVGATLSFDANDFSFLQKKTKQPVPTEFLAFSFLMMQKPDKINLERYNSEFFYGELMPAVKHIIDNMGQNLSDTPDTMSFANIIKTHLKHQLWSLGEDRRSKIKKGADFSGYKAMKLLQVAGKEFFKEVAVENRQRMDQTFGR